MITLKRFSTSYWIRFTIHRHQVLSIKRSFFHVNLNSTSVSLFRLSSQSYWVGKRGMVTSPVEDDDWRHIVRTVITIDDKIKKRLVFTSLLYCHLNKKNRCVNSVHLMRDPTRTLNFGENFFLSSNESSFRLLCVFSAPGSWSGRRFSSRFEQLPKAKGPQKPRPEVGRQEWAFGTERKPLLEEDSCN